jgi:hypothetical protein
MSDKKTPQRVNAGARPESGPEHRQMSDLVEIAKQNGDFSKNYGRWLGAFLYLRSMNAARNRPVLWRRLITLGTVAAVWVLKYGMPAFAG